MRQSIIIYLLVLVSCSSRNESIDSSFYSDARLSFYNPSDQIFSLNVWVRKPENIRTLHETFKKYGYNKLFSDEELTSNPCMIWSYINKPCSTLIDSLILTYPESADATKYYKEFWERRKIEQNDTTVFAVLKEVREELLNKVGLPFREQLTNDTIYHLLRIKFKQPENEAEAKYNFEYLRNLGLNLSAYNLLYESYWYQDLRWDRERMKRRLKPDTIDNSHYPIIVDDTK